MKQRIIYESDRNRKKLFEANKEFADRMGEIFAEHLKVEHWVDADEDGLCGGITIRMDYESYESTEFILLENNKISVVQCDEEGENEREIELTEDELKVIYFIIKDGEIYARDEAQEAASYNKDIYAYNGHRRSDF